jgi:hypothetical protein
LSSILKSRAEIEKSRRKITIVGPHFGFPSDFAESCPEFQKVRRLSKKSDNFRQSQTEIVKVSRLSEFPSAFLDFPDRFSKRQTTFEISGQLFENPAGNRESRPTSAKVVRLLQFPADFAEKPLFYRHHMIYNKYCILIINII